MTKLEIVKSQEYHDLLRKLNPLMNFDLEYDDIQQMIDYFKYQSNVDDKVSYMERHMVTYEIMKNSYFFLEFKDLTLIGLYTNPNENDHDYFILVEKDGTVHFIGDSIINWTNSTLLPFQEKDVFEFQTACYYKYNIPTVTWIDKTVKIAKTITPDEFTNDYKYQNYLKSDMLYDTYNYLKDTGIVGVNKKQLRMRVRGIAENDGVVAFHVQDDMTLSENIFDKRFFTHIPNLKGFMDLDIQYTYHEDGVIEITDYKATKPSLFNLVGFFSNFKARLKLYSYFITFFRLALRLFAIMFLIDNNINKPKK